MPKVDGLELLSAARYALTEVETAHGTPRPPS
jgi:hypothetical protein